MLKGRDLGKMKESGRLRGTQAYRVRAIFVWGMMAYSVAFGFYK